MSQFKFIHAADIHLDSPLRGLERYEGAPVDSIRQASRRALENLVMLALNEQVAFVIIAGDLFDGDWKDYNTGLFFVKQMSRLQEAGIAVYLLKGNHDAANKLSKSLPLPDNVHVFAHKNPETFLLSELNTAIHGQSFSTSDLREDISLNYPAPHSGKFNIGVLHTCAGGREGHDSYAPCKLDALRSKGYNYWALGHIHKREILSEDPLVIFPGNIQGRHIRETGPKGCFLLSVDDRFHVRAEFCELSVMRWDLLKVDVTDARGEDEIFALVSEALDAAVAAADNMPLAVRVELLGETALDSSIRAGQRYLVESVRALGLQRAAEQIWIEKVKIHTQDLKANSLEHFDGPLAELLKLIDESRDNKEALSILQDELQHLRSRLPAELPELRLKSSNDWINRSLNDVQQILLSRLVKTEAGK